MTLVLRTTTVLVVVVVLLSSFGWSSRLAVPAYFYGDRGEGANITAPSLPDAGQWGQLVGQGVAPPNTVAIACVFLLLFLPAFFPLSIPFFRLCREGLRMWPLVPGRL